MCDMSVDVATICQRFDVGLSHFDGAFLRLRELEKQGLCFVSGSKVVIPVEARVLLRTIAQCFDAYSAPEVVTENRHAKAV
jgi:oxygen-independent coproporphyrinogen-3 oxidase